MKKYLFYVNIALFGAVIWSFYNKRAVISHKSPIDAQLPSGAVHSSVQPADPMQLIGINNKNIKGQINLNNNSFSNLKINYQNKEYELLQCNETWNAAWRCADSQLPDKRWSLNNNILSSEKPLIATWKNPEGSIFAQSMQIIDDYIIKVEYSVFNALSKAINIGLDLNTQKKGNFIYHKGDRAVRTSKSIVEHSDSWHGFETEYSAFIVIPNNSLQYTYNSTNSAAQISFPAQTINPKESCTWSFYIFAGPKKLDLLNKYAKKYNAKDLDQLINYGLLSFITKPIFVMLSYIFTFFKNFTFAICLLTLIVKIILAPFSYKSHVSMLKMQKLQPQIERIKEIYKGNSVAIQQAILALYKQESINPLGGILPFIFQIPLFIALYSAISISIDVVNSKFLWISDLSMPDPCSLKSLVAYFTSYSLPFNINFLSAVFSASMIMQQWNNFKNQKDHFILALPIVSAVLLSNYSAAFMLYMVWSNMLAYLQSSIFNRISRKYTKPIQH